MTTRYLRIDVHPDDIDFDAVNAKIKSLDCEDLFTFFEDPDGKLFLKFEDTLGADLMGQVIKVFIEHGFGQLTASK